MTWTACYIGGNFGGAGGATVQFIMYAQIQLGRNLESKHEPLLAPSMRDVCSMARSLLQLPVQRVTKVEFFLNLKAAATLGIVLPASLISSADEVIE
jgi:hypothetical protein